MPSDAEQLKYDLVYALSDAAPDGWQRIDLTCRAHADEITVLTADCGQTRMATPPEVARLVHRLREGSWFSLRFTVDPPTRFRIGYNRDWGPDWEPAADPQVWERELAAFPSDADRQKRLWTLVANLVILTVPIDSAHVSLSYRAAGDHVELTARVRRLSDGGHYLWEPPRQVRELMARLRADMYRPGLGTWFEITASVGPGAAIDYEHSWDRKPLWDRVPSAASFAKDLARFPRTPESIPAWLAERLGPAEPLPPAPS